jgi:beta-glucuronidase
MFRACQSQQLDLPGPRLSVPTLPQRTIGLHPAAPRDTRDLVEYNFAKSDTLTVPGDWNSQKKDLFYYEGTVWYERSFTYRKPPGRRVFLGVGAANYLARVYVNGAEVCEHEEGFTGFNCEVTDPVKDGENFVVIYVNKARPAGLRAGCG